MTTRWLSESIAPERNSFNLVRLLAAIGVIVSHAFLIPNGVGSQEPLQQLTGLTLGQHAVHVFFVISGLTLARSLELSSSMVRYAVSRFLRIVPALVGFGVIFAFIVGPIVSKSPWEEYFLNEKTWQYPFLVWLQFQNTPPPPPIFESVPIAGAVNNPLWTIKYEIFAYVGLGLFAVGRLFQKMTVLVGTLVALAALTIALQPYELNHSLGPLFQAAKFGTCFMLGVVAYFLKQFIPAKAIWLAVSLLIAVAFSNSNFAILPFILLDAHFALIVGSHDYGALSAWTRVNDVSYGAYIYGWPTHQSLVAIFPGIGMFSGGALTLIIVLTVGLLSWRAIEKPALLLKPSARVTRDSAW